MFERILVPLDGTKRSEKAIPVAARIARASKGTIVLVEVILPPVEFGTYTPDRTVALKPGAFVERTETAASYLRGITMLYASDLAGIDVETEILAGAVSPELSRAASKEKADLIVLCSRGEVGLKRRVFGSVAQEMERHSATAVLVLNEHEARFPASGAPHPLRVLVPLDGSLLSEEALLPAASLTAAVSSSPQSELHLLRVVDGPLIYENRKGQAYMSDLVREGALQDAEMYLESVIERRTKDLMKLNLCMKSSVVASMNVAGAIVQEAEQARGTASSFDLIAMTTHGRSGLLRVALGSVTENVLGATKLPLLIIRSRQAKVKPGYSPCPSSLAE
jgi:nucleotide-binding universal stress UspA family protein